MSAIDICNAALAKNHHLEAIPADADLTNPVGKAQILCARFYDQARREALRLAPWTCVKKRVRLQKETWASVWPYAAGDMLVTPSAVFECTTAGTSGATEPTWPTTGTIADGTAVWTYRYATREPLPAENLTGLAYAYATPADYINQVEMQNTDGEPIHFEMEGGTFFSDHDEPILVYIPDATDDTKWDPLLREVIITQLASLLAYPMTGKHDEEIAFARAAMAIATQAQGKTKRERRQGMPPSEPWADGLFTTRYTS